jgi:hypothetical protein
MSVSNGPNLGLIINALTGDSYPSDFRKLLRAIDVLLEGAVIDRTHTSPPGSPTNGNRYIVKATGSGAWAGHDNHIAVWTTDNPSTPSGLWEFYVPKEGFVVWSAADASLYAFTSGAWAAAGGGGGGGSSTLAGLTDVALTSPANGDVLTYDTGSTQWKNLAPSGGGGSSAWNASTAKRRAFVSSGGNDGTSGITGTQGGFGDLTTLLGSVWTQNVAASASSPKRGQSTEFRNTSADHAGGIIGNAIWLPEDSIQALFELAIGRTTDVTMWVGLTDGSADTWGVGANPAGNYAAFRFDVISAGDTTIQCITKDGSTQTIVDSAVTPTTNGMRLAIVMDHSVPNVKFYIGGVLKATITTHLPTSGTKLRYYAAVAWHSSQASCFISHIEISADF